MSIVLGSLVILIANLAFFIRICFNKKNFNPILEIFFLYLFGFIKLIIVIVLTMMIFYLFQIKIIEYLLGFLVMQLIILSLIPFVIKLFKTRKKL